MISVQHGRRKFQTSLASSRRIFPKNCWAIQMHAFFTAAPHFWPLSLLAKTSGVLLPIRKKYFLISRSKSDNIDTVKLWQIFNSQNIYVKCLNLISGSFCHCHCGNMQQQCRSRQLHIKTANLNSMWSPIKKWIPWLTYWLNSDLFRPKKFFYTSKWLI